MNLWLTLSVARRRLLAATPSPPAPAVLDAYTAGLINAWSISRRLVSSHLGPLIRVRADRAGQPEMDIGFEADNSLSVGALVAFAAGDDCYCVTAYNQTGNPSYEQGTASSQPKIVNAGSVIVNEIGQPVCLMEGQRFTASLSIPWPHTIYNYLRGTNDGNYRIFTEYTGLSELRRLGKTDTGGFYAHGGVVTSGTMNGLTQQMTYVWANDPVSDRMYVNQNFAGGGEGGGNIGTTNGISWGDLYDGGTPWAGSVMEQVIYAAEHDDTTRQEVEAALAL